jgi:hypothetical protein
MPWLDSCYSPRRAIACLLLLLVSATTVNARVITTEGSVNGLHQAGPIFHTPFAALCQRAESWLGQHWGVNASIDASQSGSPSPADVSNQGFWEPSLTKVLGEVMFRDTAEHKPLWPLNWRDALTLFFAIVSLFVAAGGGIGGGGVLVPLFILILGEYDVITSLLKAPRLDRVAVVLHLSASTRPYRPVMEHIERKPFTRAVYELFHDNFVVSWHST